MSKIEQIKEGKKNTDENVDSPEAQKNRLRFRLFRKVSIINDNLERLAGHNSFVDKKLRDELCDILKSCKKLAATIERERAVPELTINIVPNNRAMHTLGNFISSIAIPNRLFAPKDEKLADDKLLPKQFYEQKNISDNLYKCFKNKADDSVEYIASMANDNAFLKREIETECKNTK